MNNIDKQSTQAYRNQKTSELSRHEVELSANETETRKCKTHIYTNTQREKSHYISQAEKKHNK